MYTRFSSKRLCHLNGYGHVLENTFRDKANAAPAEWCVFESRLRHEWERLFGLLIGLYGGQYDFFFHLEEIMAATARSWLETACLAKGAGCIA